MKIGFNSVLFGGHDVETAFKYAAICGYDGLEISAINGMSDHMIGPVALKELSAKYNVPILAMEQPSQDPATMEVAFQAAAAMGCPIVNCGPGGKSNDEATFQQSIDSLGKLAALAGKYGVTLCFKAHVGAAIYNTPTTLRALQAIPAIGLDMDPSHIHRANENPVDALSAVVKRIKHVHIRDCKGRQQNPGTPEMQANGRGEIDLLGYIRTLHQAGYTGPVDLEVIGAKEYDIPRCVAIAAEARGHMQACLQASGAR
ncbi:MAG: sugar phosphate isomerase/epimerase [Verrucomicrobiota bacterium]